MMYASARCDREDYEGDFKIFAWEMEDQMVVVGSANHNGAPFILCREVEFFSTHSDAPIISYQTCVPTPREIRKTIMIYFFRFTVASQSLKS